MPSSTRATNPWKEGDDPVKAQTVKATRSQVKRGRAKLLVETLIQKTKALAPRKKGGKDKGKGRALDVTLAWLAPKPELLATPPRGPASFVSLPAWSAVLSPSPISAGPSAAPLLATPQAQTEPVSAALTEYHPDSDASFEAIVAEIEAEAAAVREHRLAQVTARAAEELAKVENIRAKSVWAEDNLAVIVAGGETIAKETPAQAHQNMGRDIPYHEFIAADPGHAERIRSQLKGIAIGRAPVLASIEHRRVTGTFASGRNACLASR